MFQFQQLPLFVNAPGVSGQAAVCADHTVTGNDDGYLIMTHRTADRLRRHPGKLLLFSKLPCDLAVGRSPSVGNLQKDFPHGLPERGADGVQRRQKIRLAASKINVQPTPGFCKGGCILPDTLCGQITGKVFLSVEPQTSQSDSVRCQQDAAQR